LSPNIYSGIDLHSNNSVVVVSDEADRVLVRRRVPNDAAAILALLAAHWHELVGVVVESTYNWYWLVDALQAARYRVRLPPPATAPARSARSASLSLRISTRPALQLRHRCTGYDVPRSPRMPQVVPAEIPDTE
jgi:hypothetical protein